MRALSRSHTGHWRSVRQMPRNAIIGGPVIVFTTRNEATFAPVVTPILITRVLSG